MKRGKITHQIDQLRREMNSNLSAEFLEVYSGNKQNFKGKQIDSKKIASSSRDRYVLIKNPKSKEENVLFNTNIETSHFSEKQSNKEENDHFRKLDRLPSTFNAIRKANYNFPKFLSDDSSDDEIANLLKKKKQEKLKNTTKSFTENKSIKNATDIEYMSKESSDSGLEIEEKYDEKQLHHREDHETVDSANEGSSSVGLASVNENNAVSETVSPLVNGEIQNINKLDEKVFENNGNISVDESNPGLSDKSVRSKNLSKKLSEENGEIKTKLENRTEKLTIDIPDMEKLYSQSESTEILSPVSNKELNLISPLKDKQYVFPSPVTGNLEELVSPASVRSTDSVADKTTEQKKATSNHIEVSQQARVFQYFRLVLLLSCRDLMFASVHKGDFLSFQILFYFFCNFLCVLCLKGLNAVASVGESSEKVGVKYEEIHFSTLGFTFPGRHTEIYVQVVCMVRWINASRDISQKLIFLLKLIAQIIACEQSDWFSTRVQGTNLVSSNTKLENCFWDIFGQ